MRQHIRRRLACPVAALLSGMAVAAMATPSTPWKPVRPVTLVVPYAAGGGTDATARAVSRQLGAIWGQPVIVENLPGADGLIGTRKVMEARPDGYTLLLQVPAITITSHLPGFKGIDPLAKLQPITAISQSPAVIVASAKLPVSTLADLVRHCKTAAQPCSMGSGETLARISGKQLAAEAGLPNLVVVNYRGTGAIVTDLIANNVNMSFTGITAALPHYKAGTLKILATQDRTRAAALPEVPTTTEAGFPQFQSVTWFGLFAPKGTPIAIAEGLVIALREGIKDPEVRRTIAAAGAEPVVNSPAEFAAQVRHDRDRLEDLIKRYPLE